MAIDLSGGIDPAREYMFAERPDDPEMRDSVSFWVVDDRGEVGLPRVGIEAVAANWGAHDVQVNIAFADGRVYRLRDNGPSLPPEGPDGRPSVLGAGGLVFRCVQPFDTWTMSFGGKAVQTTSSDLIDAKKDGPLVDVRFHVEATMAARLGYRERCRRSRRRRWRRPSRATTWAACATSSCSGPAVR